MTVYKHWKRHIPRDLFASALGISATDAADMRSSYINPGFGVTIRFFHRIDESTGRQWDRTWGNREFLRALALTEKPGDLVVVRISYDGTVTLRFLATAR